MNIPMAMLLKGFTSSQNLDYVPANGELMIDKETNLIKIGDGKTKVADLSYVSNAASSSIGVDLATEPAKFEPSDVAKEVIKKHKDLIASNNFDEFYKQLEGASIFLIRDVTKMLLEAGINVNEHLTTVPTCIQDMLLGKPQIYDCQIEDLSAYTISEINAKLHEVTEEVTKQLFSAMRIPANIITGEN